MRPCRPASEADTAGMHAPRIRPWSRRRQACTGCPHLPALQPRLSPKPQALPWTSRALLQHHRGSPSHQPSQPRPNRRRRQHSRVTAPRPPFGHRAVTSRNGLAANTSLSSNSSISHKHRGGAHRPMGAGCCRGQFGGIRNPPWAPPNPLWEPASGVKGSSWEGHNLRGSPPTSSQRPHTRLQISACSPSPVCRSIMWEASRACNMAAPTNMTHWTPHLFSRRLARYPSRSAHVCCRNRSPSFWVLHARR